MIIKILFCSFLRLSQVFKSTSLPSKHAPSRFGDVFDQREHRGRFCGRCRCSHGAIHGERNLKDCICMPPGTAEEDRSPPRSENQGFRRNYFSFFGNPLTPNSSKFEISPKFCEVFFNSVKFRQIFIKICSKTLEIDSKFVKNDEIWRKNCKTKNEKLTYI